MLVYKIWHYGYCNGYIEKDIEGVKAFLESELNELEAGESVQIRYECIEMDEEEYNNLPEFTGF